MSMVFVDRESAYPNRYRVIPETGSPYYIVLERADEPVTPGTPLNAETFNAMRDDLAAEMAPGGFGLGTEPADAEGDANNAISTGWYQVQGANTPSAGIWWDIFVISSLKAGFAGGYSVKQFAFDRYGSSSENGSCFLFRSKAGGGEWSPWEWVNPPMGVGVEYRTIERYQDAAVYKKLDISGNILWRKDGESQWHLLSSAGYVAAATVE